jgi:hypothetical protein
MISPGNGSIPVNLPQLIYISDTASPNLQSNTIRRISIREIKALVVEDSDLGDGTWVWSSALDRSTFDNCPLHIGRVARPAVLDGDSGAIGVG